MKTKEFYSKTITMKMYLGLYFAAFVFLYGAIRVLFDFQTIDILVLLEMAIASFIIAVLQVLLIPDKLDLSKHLFFRSSILWLFLSLATVYGFAYFGNWFTMMHTYTIYAFSICACIGFLAMLIGLRYLQEADTIRLNQALQIYQDKKD